MNISKIFFVFIFTACAFTSYAQNTHSANPLLVHSNEPVRFDKVNASAIRDAVKEVMKISDAIVRKIIAVSATAHTSPNTLMAFDELSYHITDLSMKLGLIGSTYPDDSTRNTANDEGGKLSVYANNLFLNDDLYKAAIDFAASSVATQLKPNQQKFLTETIIAFEKKGMKLDEAGRKDIKVLNEKLVNYGIEFDKNIAESKDSVQFEEQDLAGVAASIKAPWRRANGKYVVV
ncbi:MAG: hypothetical protein ABIN93_04145, partial [Ginsengibacter sp.]